MARLAVRSTRVATRLSETKILAGGEFKLVIANAVFGFLAIALLHIWQYLVVVVILHLLLVLVAKADPKAREIYLEYAKQGDCYTPWQETRRQPFNRRPLGFGRDQEI